MRNSTVGFPVGESPRLCRGDEGSRRAKQSRLLKLHFSPLRAPSSVTGDRIRPRQLPPWGSPSQLLPRGQTELGRLNHIPARPKRHSLLGFPVGEAPRLCRGDEGSLRAKTNLVAETTFSPARRNFHLCHCEAAVSYVGCDMCALRRT